MGFLDGLVTASLIGFGIHALRKSNEKARQAKEDEEKRACTPCDFSDGISEEDFEDIAHKAAKRIKRIADVTVDGTLICVAVRTQSGINTWGFRLDFNDYGHITGSYWWKTDNHDSKIPEALGDMIQAAINQRL